MQPRIILRNSFANLVRGGIIFAVTLIQVPLLARLMPTSQFSTWMLIAQASAYLAVLDFGLQTIVARRIARAMALGDTGEAGRVLSTAVGLLCAAAGLGVILSGFGALALPALFPSMPADLLGEARLAVWVAGAGVAITLPGSAFASYFVGIQRNERVALATGAARIAAGLGVVGAAALGASLPVMALALAAGNGASTALFLAQFAASGGRVRISPASASSTTARQLLRDCVDLAWWTSGTFLVSGLDAVIVGRFDFAGLAPYTVAANLTGIFVALMGAAFSSMMAPAAQLHARGDARGLRNLLSRATLICAVLVCAFGLPVGAFAGVATSVWGGPAGAAAAAVILRVLLVAQGLRVLTLPYAYVLVGTGQQRAAAVAPFAEGLTNLAVSLAATPVLGAMGCAIGTLAGAVVGAALHGLVNFPRGRGLQIS